ncbi:MAG: type II toxin-antitoxin system PemK/MazF family toxin [Ottowia sp.]|nr:type II toxin-antitoxin system PemK/MazF family toxin [Ottowia sp.]
MQISLRYRISCCLSTRARAACLPFSESIGYRALLKKMGVAALVLLLMPFAWAIPTPLPSIFFVPERTHVFSLIVPPVMPLDFAQSARFSPLYRVISYRFNYMATVLFQLNINVSDLINQRGVNAGLWVIPSSIDGVNVALQNDRFDERWCTWLKVCILRRGELWWVEFDLVFDSEIQKTRSAVIARNMVLAR